MRIAIIGRSEVLYESAILLLKHGFTISCIFTAKEAPEYSKGSEDFRHLANKINVPFESSGKIRDYKSFFEESNSDIAISMNYTNIIPQEIINIFPLGILNAHGGDLPRYRGNACQAWAILNGEKRIGLCVHKMIGNELDSGDIVMREYLKISDKTKITEVWKWMSSRIPNLMLKALEKLNANPDFVLQQQSKDPSHILYCYPRKPEDGRINWNESAINILRLINASNKPYAGAFCEFRGEKIIIWDAELVSDNDIFCAVPGQVTKILGDSIEIACKDQKLRIFKIEYMNKVISAPKLINSIRSRLN